MENPNKKFLALLLVPVLLIAAVAGYYLYDDTIDVDVDEGFAELSICELPEEGEILPGMEFLQDDNSTTVKTYVNDDSYIKMNISSLYIIRCPVELRIIFDIHIEGVFEKELDIETLKLVGFEPTETEGPFNGLDVFTSYTNIEGGEMWPENVQRLGGRLVSPESRVFTGYDLDSNSFTLDNRLQWVLPSENIGEELTLELRGVIDGRISQEVITTLQIHIEGGDGL